MKHTFRFIIAGVVLAGVIFGLWALFFNPDKRIGLDNRLSAVKSIDESYSISEKMNTIKVVWSNKKIGDNKIDLSSDSGKKVITQLDRLFNNSITVESPVGVEYNNINSYLYYYDKLFLAYDFYSVYSVDIGSISAKDLKIIKNCISSYESNIKNLSIVLDKLVDNYINYFEIEGNVLEEGNEKSAWISNMCACCTNVNNSYIDVLYSLSDLAKNVRDICVKYVFGDTYLNTTSSIIYDCIINQAYETFLEAKESSEYELKRLVDLELFCRASDLYENDQQSFFNKVELSEMKLINSYTILEKTYSDKLESYFKQVRSEKNALYNNETTKPIMFDDCLEYINILNKMIFKMM